MRISAYAGNRFHFVKLRATALAICVASGLLLSGCAGINGVQDPVTKADLANTLCPSQEELHRFADALDAVRTTDENALGMSQQAYRDTIINNCVDAATANFHSFTRALRRDSMNVKLGVDAAVLTLSGLAAVGNGAKNAAAAIEGLVGMNAAINKDVYFDQTLPALAKAMEINFNETLARIRLHQQQSASEYTLGAAGSELIELQNASDINLAISQLVTVTTDKAQQTADVVLPAPPIISEDIPPDTEKAMLSFYGYLGTLWPNDTDRDKLVAIAKKLGMTDADIAPLINRDLAGHIGNRARSQVQQPTGLAGLKTTLGDSVPAEAWTK